MSNLLAGFQAAIAAPVPSKKVKIKHGESELEVEVRAMSGAVKKAYRAHAKKNDGEMEVAEAKLVVASTFDPKDGTPVFTDDHIPLIVQAPYLFEKIMDACNELNGWKEEKKAG